MKKQRSSDNLVRGQAGSPCCSIGIISLLTYIVIVLVIVIAILIVTVIVIAIVVIIVIVIVIAIAIVIVIVIAMVIAELRFVATVTTGGRVKFVPAV